MTLSRSHDLLCSANSVCLVVNGEMVTTFVSSTVSVVIMSPLPAVFPCKGVFELVVTGSSDTVSEIATGISSRAASVVV